ncbi:hypothetical protein ACIRQO_36525 [Streptomyces anulatus]
MTYQPSPVTDLRWLRPYAPDAAAYDVCVLHPVPRAVEHPGEDAFSFGYMWTEAARVPRLRDAALAAWRNVPHQAGTALPVSGAYFAVWELGPRDGTSARPLSARRHGSRALPCDPDRAVVYAGGRFHQLHQRVLDRIYMFEDE